ncbi:gamma-glutamyl-gamma-aminobutyrate hydrolase family protein [Psychrosphaera aquimarina]|uniref:Gamma-glutamyl-gamma-aminobutyrate hydrolase family protein n=1 Tax=Psychrosphaera aquimarina TaxID=2044854 RepID=A0ABU3QVN6_9GAMM|nr:gamma-glutamyl-gamma-aminobutyrate hydrolase family protein [Psychrosphaera aquimarina]MDU0111483.1 gamma-glutamyl-gamma-aminobutyrate hydrolase family protein [Psychrosphaera aquimarina]
MAKRPRIGVTGNARRWTPSWWCISLAIRLSGGVPMRITTRHQPINEQFDALIISGGSDISPEHYGGDIKAKVKSDPARDKLEIQWIQKAIAEHKPLLGICRGAQLINVVLDGDLHDDLRTIRHLTYNRPGLLPTKQVYLNTDSVVYNICGKQKIWVNSLHHQAINNVATCLRVVGKDRDQIVQAVETNNGEQDINRNIIGVQWHPEYLFYLPSQFGFFRWLIKQTFN